MRNKERGYISVSIPVSLAKEVDRLVGNICVTRSGRAKGLHLAIVSEGFEPILGNEDTKDPH